MPDVEEVVSRLDRRPGFKVVSFCEVGLPIFSVVPLVTLREQSEIGVLEETVLKCLEANVDTVASLVSFLGVPSEIVSTQIGALLYEQLARHDPATDRYSLTARGLTRLDELATTHVYKDEIRLFIDGLTREIVPIEQVDLYSGRQLDALAIPAVTPSPRFAPRATEISVSQVNRLFTLRAKTENIERHAIKVEAYVRRTSLMFRRAIAIAFKPDSGRGMSIAFAVDGRISNEHEIAFSVSGADQRSGLFKDLFDPAKRRFEIVAARRHTQEFAPSALDAQPRTADQRPTLKLPKRTGPKPETVKTLSSYEHAPLLGSAFGSATQRLLIISPWIRRQVVNEEFLRKLSACLERNVEVTIAFGFGKTDRGERAEDAEARKQLEALSESFKTFRLIRKSNIHAKVLLVDDKYFVTTSFNWLSFRGDPSQPLREEEGTYVEGTELVNDYFERLRNRLQF
jgi:hypothetical protein